MAELLCGLQYFLHAVSQSNPAKKQSNFIADVSRLHERLGHAHVNAIFQLTQKVVDGMDIDLSKTL